MSAPPAWHRSLRTSSSQFPPSSLSPKRSRLRRTKSLPPSHFDASAWTTRLAWPQLAQSSSGATGKSSGCRPDHPAAHGCRRRLNLDRLVVKERRLWQLLVEQTDVRVEREARSVMPEPALHLLRVQTPRKEDRR